MMKLKDIEKHFPNSYRSENNQRLIIRWCDVGDNFYDYGDKQLPIKFFNKEIYDMVANDPRIELRTCEDCGSCAGW